MNGVALAWITAEPIDTDVTGTLAVVAPAANVTVAGTVATAVLLELVFTVSPPAGAAAERCQSEILNLDPGNGRRRRRERSGRVHLDRSSRADIARRANSNIGSADIDSGNRRLRRRSGGPCATVTVEGETVTLVASLLARDTVNGAGAGADRLIASAEEAPRVRVLLAGATMLPALCTVTVMVVSGMNGVTFA